MKIGSVGDTHVLRWESSLIAFHRRQAVIRLLISYVLDRLDACQANDDQGENPSREGK